MQVKGLHDNAWASRAYRLCVDVAVLRVLCFADRRCKKFLVLGEEVGAGTHRLAKIAGPLR